MGGIELHSEKGVNPKLIDSTCPVCGVTASSGIALLGRHDYKDVCYKCGLNAYGGKPKDHTCPKCGSDNWTREPVGDNEHIHEVRVCDTCEGYMKQGIVLISIRDGDEGKENPYRTGGFAVVKDDAIKRIVNDDKLTDSIIRRRMCMIPTAAWNMMGLPVITDPPVAEVKADVV